MYVSCQPVITLFVPVMDTLYGDGLDPCTMTRTMDILNLDWDGYAKFLLKWERTEPTEAIACSSTKVGVPHLECDDTKCEAWPDRHRLALPVHLRVGLVHLHQLHQVPLQLLEQAVFHVAQAILALPLNLLILVFCILEVEACVVAVRDS